MKKTISIPEAARRTGCFTTYLYELVRNGKLPAKKVDGRWEVDEAAFKSWHKTHRFYRPRLRVEVAGDDSQI